MEFHLPLDAKISDLPLGSGMAHLPWLPWIFENHWVSERKSTNIVGCPNLCLKNTLLLYTGGYKQTEYIMPRALGYCDVNAYNIAVVGHGCTIGIEPPLNPTSIH